MIQRKCHKNFIDRNVWSSKKKTNRNIYNVRNPIEQRHTCELRSYIFPVIFKKNHSKGHETHQTIFFVQLYFWKIMKMKLDIHFYLQLKQTNFSFNNFTRFRFHEAMMQYTSQH